MRALIMLVALAASPALHAERILLRDGFDVDAPILEPFGALFRDFEMSIADDGTIYDVVMWRDQNDLYRLVCFQDRVLSSQRGIELPIAGKANPSAGAGLALHPDGDRALAWWTEELSPFVMGAFVDMTTCDLVAPDPFVIATGLSSSHGAVAVGPRSWLVTWKRPVSDEHDVIEARFIDDEQLSAPILLAAAAIHTYPPHAIENGDEPIANWMKLGEPAGAPGASLRVTRIGRSGPAQIEGRHVTQLPYSFSAVGVYGDNRLLAVLSESVVHTDENFQLLLRGDVPITLNDVEPGELWLTLDGRIATLAVGDSAFGEPQTEFEFFGREPQVETHPSGVRDIVYRNGLDLDVLMDDDNVDQGTHQALMFAGAPQFDVLAARSQSGVNFVMWRDPDIPLVGGTPINVVRLSDSGEPLGTPQQIVTNNGDQIKLVGGVDDALLAWRDDEVPSCNCRLVVATRVSAVDGTLLDAALLEIGGNRFEQPQEYAIAPLTNGGFVAVTAQRATAKLMARVISAEGVVSDSIQLSDHDGTRVVAPVASASADGVLVAWQEFPDTLRTVRFDPPFGSVLPSVNVLTTSARPRGQCGQSILIDSGVIVDVGADGNVASQTSIDANVTSLVCNSEPFLAIGMADDDAHLRAYDVNDPTRFVRLLRHDGPATLLPMSAGRFLGVFSARTAGTERAQAAQVDLDLDTDGIYETEDNCVDVPNSDQLDADDDDLGDACDPCLVDPFGDTDGDGICDGLDSCIFIDDLAQLDSDGDLVGDACDNCLDVADVDQADIDGDGEGNPCDPDDDGDELLDDLEVSVGTNPGAADSDADGLLDATEVGNPEEPFDSGCDGLIDALDPEVQASGVTSCPNDAGVNVPVSDAGSSAPPDAGVDAGNSERPDEPEPEGCACRESNATPMFVVALLALVGRVRRTAGSNLS